MSKPEYHQPVLAKDARGKLRAGIYTGYSEKTIYYYHVKFDNGTKRKYTSLRQIRAIC